VLVAYDVAARRDPEWDLLVLIVDCEVPPADLTRYKVSEGVVGRERAGDRHRSESGDEAAADGSEERRAFRGSRRG
jgi:hypothetical protein